MNKGTRSSQQPLGNGALRREIVGDEIMHRTLHLCKLLHEHGSKFTLENPRTSYAWMTPKVVDLISSCGCTVVHFDQCQYGLKIPDSNNILGLAKQATSMVGTMPNLHRLERACDHSRTHVPVIGGVKRKGKWQKRSALAGAYPKQLCAAYAKAFRAAFSV